MIRTFTYDGEEYSYIPYEELQDSELPMNYPTRKKKKPTTLIMVVALILKPL